MHAYETVWVLLLAFGPFLVLVAVVVATRRRDVEEEERDHKER